MRPMASDRAVLTVKEVSELLQISEGTVYKMIKEGRIPCFQIGSEWKILNTIQRVRGAAWFTRRMA